MSLSERAGGPCAIDLGYKGETCTLDNQGDVITGTDTHHNHDNRNKLDSNVPTDTLNASASQQTSRVQLEKSLRKMKINELSAEDDDEDLSEVRHIMNNQSASGIFNRSIHDRSQFEYDMSHTARGKAIIVNNVNFEPKTGMSERAGSQKDADELTEVLRMLGFSTERYSDLTCSQLLRVFQDVSTEDHTECDCFMFVVMTHGTDNVIYCTDDVLSPDQLIQELRGDRCLTLAGKPKLFFFQACRGQILDEGVALTGEDVIDDTDSGSTRGGSVVIPAEADFLVAYSSPPGYYSWRNVSTGSWFIQALIEVLMDHGTSLEINQILTRVNHTVAYQHMSHFTMADFNKKKQMPFYTSSLTKELYFRMPKQRIVNKLCTDV